MILFLFESKEVLVFAFQNRKDVRSHERIKVNIYSLGELVKSAMFSGTCSSERYSDKRNAKKIFFLFNVGDAV